MISPVARCAGLVAAALVAAGVVVVGAALPAYACTPGTRYDDAIGTTYYENCSGQDGSDGSDGDDGSGGGGNAEPSCEFDGIWDDFCRGSKPCYMFDPANLQDDDYARENGYPDLPEKPDDADHLIFVSCLLPGGDRDDQYYWDSQFDEVPSVRDRLLAAYGQLTLPDVTPVFNPPVRTLVNLDTWWWAEGGSADPLVGTEALGLVAIAEPRSMTVSAAGQSITCPVVTDRSDECSLVFTHAGDYTATMVIVYDVRFELGGQPFTVPGGNDDLLSVQSEDQVDVPVVEVQTRVTGLR